LRINNYSVRAMRNENAMRGRLGVQIIPAGVAADGNFLYKVISGALRRGRRERDE
jgi:hypothetical protein